MTAGPAAPLLVRKDLWAGLLLAAFGIAGLVLGADLPLGRAGRMGPGYFPRGLSLILIAFGAAIVLRGVIAGSDAVERTRLRPLVGVLAGGIAFAMLIDTGGIVLASAAAIAGAAAADRDTRWGEVVVLAAAMIALCVTLFVWLLQLPMHLWFR